MHECAHSESNRGSSHIENHNCYECDAVPLCHARKIGDLGLVWVYQPDRREIELGVTRLIYGYKLFFLFVIDDSKLMRFLNRTFNQSAKDYHIFFHEGFLCTILCLLMVDVYGFDC